ncbi:MAG: hypothetical protein NWE96_01100 [Candidatus Bathyarchaeota archaeon]|nr:hypothetical protein [Candidatus Bathyarchaeota archaeon]
MKNLEKVIVVVTLCAVIIALAIVASLTNNNSNANNLINSPTPTATSNRNTNTDTPAPSNVPTSNVIFTYLEDSRTKINNNTRLILSINATLASDNPFEVDYSKFYLYVWIEGQNSSKGLLNMHHYNSLESGSKYLDTTEKTAIIKLTFEFPSEAMGFEGNIVPFSFYTLSYLDQPVPQQ